MLSAVVIVKNEEEMLEDCLASLKFCDEIIVVDDGSTDSTIEIAKKFTSNIYENSSLSKGYVEAVRKFAISKTSGDWILIVDADERVSENLSESIRDNATKNSDFSAFKLRRKNYYLGKHLWPQDDVLLRLFKKEKIENWNWKLHTSPEIDGKIGELKGDLVHFTHRNLTQMLEKTIEWSKEEARLRHEAAHPKMNIPRFIRPILGAFFSSYIKQRGYSVGVAGMVESIYQAFSAFITYARLWELQLKRSKA